jgi:hypothetical protein
MKWTALALVLCAWTVNAQTAKVVNEKARASDTPVAASPVTRAALETLERAVDEKYEKTMPEDQFFMLGATRGVYLDGYGVVFTTEVELSPSAAPNPFRPAYGRGEKMLLREKKLHRITELKKSMREMLYRIAASLEIAPPEMIAVAVTLPYFHWENSEGMARRLIMTADRKTALEAKAGSPVAAAAIKIQELF